MERGGGVVVRGGLGICVFKALETVLMVIHVWDCCCELELSRQSHANGS